MIAQTQLLDRAPAAPGRPARTTEGVAGDRAPKDETLSSGGGTAARTPAARSGTADPVEPAPEPALAWSTGLALSRKRAFLLLRFGLIIATAYLLLMDYGVGAVPLPVAALIFAVVTSNIALHWVPEHHFRSARLCGSVIVVDTLGVTAVLLYSGSAGAEFFFVYFFVLFLAAIGENLSLIALGAVVVAIGYLLAISNGEVGSVLRSEQLIRIPFLLMAATFYGYLVNRVRAERRRSKRSERTATRLEAARRDLADKAHRLEETSVRLRQEIVERKEAETELERTNSKLHDLSTRKSDFISAVSHELRTPLTSIKNATDLLLSGRLGDLALEQGRFVEMASRNTKRLTEIIDDLLDISKIEAGKQAFRFAEIDAGSLVESVCRNFLGRSDDDAPELVVECAEGLPSVWVDPHRIDQVVTNLISNAFKFTPAGGRVIVSLRSAADGVEIRVSDTGIGIAADEQEKVFGRFYQVEDPLTRHCKGTGLGLSIVRGLLAAHGVGISLESEPGSGSSFFFTLPEATAEAAESCAFEASFLGYRRHSHFASLLVIRPRIAAGAAGAAGDAGGPDSTDPVDLDDLDERVRSLLPRSSDDVVKQEAGGRLIVALVGTMKDGARVVKQKLERRLEDILPAGRILGPVSYPEDGATGAELLKRVDPSV